MIKHRILMIALLITLLATQSILMAQDPVIITVTVPEYQLDLFEDIIIPLFEAEHPTIQVQLVYNENIYFGSPLYETESDEPTFFEKVNDYVSSADVLYVQSGNLTPFATTTGAFLDLSPLVSVDDRLQPDDFYNAAWQAFQWDGGYWALPYSLQIQLLVYNQDAFDAVNFPYPDKSWRIEDYVRVAEVMHNYNSAGEVELSAMTAIDPMALFHGVIGPLYNDMTIPAQPDFSNPEFLHILESYIAYYSAYEFEEFRGYSFDEMPMTLSFPYQLAQNTFSTGEAVNWSVALLPGDVATSYSEGFAISRGTLHPEAAYTFATFMTRNIDVFQFGFGASPARRSLADFQPEEDSFYTQPEFPPEIQIIIDHAMEVAIPSSDRRYSEVLYRTRNLVETENISIEQALETIEVEILDALAEAAEQQSMQIIVAAPEIRSELSPDEVVLHFGMNTSSNINANQNLWDDLIDEFIATHPRVGEIDLDNNIYGPNGLDEDIDCWYSSFGASFVTLTEPPEGMLALDPFLNADPEFDRASFLPGVLEGVQVENLTYGYPLTVQPIIMRLNRAKFEEANLPLPTGGWTTNDFTNALVALSEIREDTDDPVVRSNLYGSSWLIMLIGSYGGKPIDFSTDPPIYDFTSPETLFAIEQVVGNFKDGLLPYQGFINNNTVFFGGSPEDDMIIIDILGDSGFSQQIQSENSSETWIVLFPEGTYLPMAFSSGMAHINSETVNFQECYDWIQTIARHPELFQGMPSRQSQFENPALIAERGPDVIEFYNSLTAGLTAPNLLALPNVYGGVASSEPGAWIVPDFFFYAFDNIVLNDADITEELAQAEANIATYHECVAGYEPLSDEEQNGLFERDQDAWREYYTQFTDCAITLVPELLDRYIYYYQDFD